MADRGGKDEESDNDTSSFMSRHFPDAARLRQNKQENRPPKPRLAGRSGATQREDHAAAELLPPGLPGGMSIGADDELSYQGNGVQNRVMRQLRRGQLAIEARLDLHGQTVTQAYRLTQQFLDECQRAGLSCVLLIHGQGYRSANGVPVLKQNINHWLREHHAVMAFHSATPPDGGRGAVYVLLRRPRR